jgi:hypothetical protein
LLLSSGAGGTTLPVLGATAPPSLALDGVGIALLTIVFGAANGPWFGLDGAEHAISTNGMPARHAIDSVITAP